PCPLLRHIRSGASDVADASLASNRRAVAPRRFHIPEHGRLRSLRMPSTTTAGAKLCCKCGRDVAGQKRMKDHMGRYWCVDCGKSDEKKKRLLDSGVCAGCGEAFHRHELSVIGDATYCKRCLRVRARKETGGFVNN